MEEAPTQTQRVETESSTQSELTQTQIATQTQYVTEEQPTFTQAFIPTQTQLAETDSIDINNQTQSGDDSIQNVDQQNTEKIQEEQNIEDKTVEEQSTEQHEELIDNEEEEEEEIKHETKEDEIKQDDEMKEDDETKEDDTKQEEEIKEDDDTKEEEEEERIEDETYKHGSDEEYKEEESSSDDEIYQEEEEEEKPSKKRKRKKGKSAPKKKKKKKSEQEGVVYDEEGDESMHQEERNEIFDEVLREITKSKRRTRDEIKLTSHDDEAVRIASELIEKMKNASKEDAQSIANKQPATARLLLLNEIATKCKKTLLQQQLVEHGLLHQFCEWLKTPDGSLPNMNIRSTILKILLDFPVQGQRGIARGNDDFLGLDTEHLKCGIGKHIRRLALHPKETPENVRMANAIIEKWSRLIFGLSDDYKLLKEHAQLATPPKRRVVKKPKVEEKKKFIPRARVPRRDGFDFVKQPPPKIREEDVLTRNDHHLSATERRLMAKLNSMKKKRGKKLL